MMAFSDYVVLHTLKRIIDRAPNDPVTYSQIIVEMGLMAVSERTMQRCMFRLESQGCIKRLGGGRSVGYRYKYLHDEVKA